ncbi:hypothetical protein GGS21DRAFT_483113 [Xylaria nigripes]|nr:hypothetical protein GGS21DRAFT_483113 [Xylaria nigripes]
MWPFVKPRLWALALISLVPRISPHLARAEGDKTISSFRDAAKSSSGPSSMEPTCESRTVNYITDSLPQQCLTIGPIASMPISDLATTTSTGPSTHADPSAQATDVVDEESDPVEEDLSTGAFMSFEEWKAMMLAKSDPDAFEAKSRKLKDGRTDVPGDGFDSLGDEGEISFDFDAYSDKISEIASSARPREQEEETKEQVEKVTYDEGFTYYRSKDAGTTCKERFSYSSFDAGATVKKTSSRAKNPTAILVENKDSYMLLECGMKNKFFIVELSDVILVDTVVIANFEFFSSMIRQFRVSISDRYPVKLDKWKVLGTFEARNSRDIQPFLVENPQDWARYLRVEILSHYGNEYYCPVSLLRVHGLRMLDSWKQVDPSDLESEDEGLPLVSEPAEETVEFVDEEPAEPEVTESVPTDAYKLTTEQSCWVPYWDGSYFEFYEFGLPPIKDCTLEPGFDGQNLDNVAQQTVLADGLTAFAERTISSTTNPSSVVTTSGQTAEPSPNAPNPMSSIPASGEGSVSSAISTPTPSSVSGSKDNTSVSTVRPPVSQTSSENAVIQSISKSKTSASTSVKSSSSKSPTKATSGSQAISRNKTSTTTSSAVPTPTVQDSFFKALTKRLQILESNTTLSLQYIESQSKFLQEALAKLERRQVAKVDLFLDKLNNTVLNELREVRTLYDHIWQSTVIALESQREQTEHEIVALSTRVGVLADEVAFQKRMAIVQSVLLLGCLVLVIFSRGFAGSAVEAYYPSQFLMSSSNRFSSPLLPSTPRAQLKGTHPGSSRSGGHSSGHTTPARTRRDSAQTIRRSSIRPHPILTDEPRSRVGSKGADLDSTLRPSTPNRVRSDPSGFEFQPPTPSSMDMAYDSEPTMTPSGDYFSAATSMNGDSSLDEREEEEDMPRLYPEMLAMHLEHQLTPGSDADGPEYAMSRSGRPGLAHSVPARKPLPSLPEDPD